MANSNTTVRILGIDPGTARTGYGILQREGSQVSVVESGLIETSPADPAEARLRQLGDAVRLLLRRHTPDAMAVEKLYFQTNVKTAMSVSEARGVILLAGAESTVPIAEYTGLQVKQSVAGYGKADKRQVADMVCRQLGLKTAPKPDDVTDALAIALCHAFWRAV